MQFRILGSLEVRDDDRLVPLPAGRARALLALLILRAGEVVSADRLVDDLWGETPPPTAGKALQGLVSALRKRLEPARTAREAPTILRTVAPGYVLTVEPDCVDAHRFRRLVAEASDAPDAERSPRLRQALSLWRGPALADFVYEPFAQREISALEELRLVAIEQRIEADLTAGSPGEVIPELEALIAEHPFREGLRAQLMLALYRAGRQADALDAYRRARRTLIEALGIEPGPTLRQLEQAILRQDSSLDPGPRRRSEPWLAAERRTVTVVFVEPAVALETADPEAARRIVARATDVAAAVLRRHGAAVEELVGDVLGVSSESPPLTRTTRCARRAQRWSCGRPGSRSGQASRRERS